MMELDVIRQIQLQCEYNRALIAGETSWYSVCNVVDALQTALGE